MTVDEPDFGLAMMAMNSAFGGHVRRDAVVVARYPPNYRPHMGPRALITILLDPNNPGSRCGVVDLLHPSEAGTPRCGNPDCRCMANDTTPDAGGEG